MGRHIVQAFHRMVVIRFVFLDQTIHNLIQIGTHIGIGIFVNGECTGDVLNKEMEKPSFGQRTGQMAQHF